MALEKKLAVLAGLVLTAAAARGQDPVAATADQEARIRAVYDQQKELWQRCEKLSTGVRPGIDAVDAAIKAGKEKERKAAQRKVDDLIAAANKCLDEHRAAVGPELKEIGAPDGVVQKVWTAWRRDAKPATP